MKKKLIFVSAMMFVLFVLIIPGCKEEQIKKGITESEKMSDGARYYYIYMFILIIMCAIVFIIIQLAILSWRLGQIKKLLKNILNKTDSFAANKQNPER